MIQPPIKVITIYKILRCVETLATWPSINPEYAEKYIEPYNCTTTFDMVDKDNNTYIDLYEFIYIANRLEFVEGELTEIKYQQINCSTCLEM